MLLGQKVVQRYFRGEGYIEMDVHIGSSAIADNIVGVCRSYSKAFICNLGKAFSSFAWYYHRSYCVVIRHIQFTLVCRCGFFLFIFLIIVLYFSGIVIQGETEEELPEHVLACAALKYCDVDVFSPLESYNF